MLLEIICNRHNYYELVSRQPAADWYHTIISEPDYVILMGFISVNIKIHTTMANWPRASAHFLDITFSYQADKHEYLPTSQLE